MLSTSMALVTKRVTSYSHRDNICTSKNDLNSRIFTRVHKQIKSWIPKDKVLSQVIQFIQQQWPAYCPDPDMKPYWNHRTEQTCLKGCIMWGSRVVIPAPSHQKLLQELHIGHPG